MPEIFNNWPLAQAAALLLIAILIGLAIHFLIWRILRGVAHRTSTVFDDALAKHGRQPSRLILPLLLMHFLSPAIRPLIPDLALAIFTKFLTILLILSIAWLLIRLGNVAEAVLLQQYDLDVADNLRARQIHTQVSIIRKLLNAAVTTLTLGAILMTFDEVRQLGAGLLASAGLAGLVVGFAAQRTLGNLLAGIQIALTQPIRLDDVVIVENEWGWIEEITLTYVVVRIWDLRRLVLPISYFIEKPFQNWTRQSADILGTVYLYTDYTVPVDPLRAELTRIVEKSTFWDGKVQEIVITDATERTMQIRALVSSVDSPKNWNLRCEVREGLIDFIQKNYPNSLPRTRWVDN